MLLGYEAEIAYRRETMLRTFARTRLPAQRRGTSQSEGRVALSLRRRAVARGTAVAPQG
jgi:hypothetical protein